MVGAGFDVARLTTKTCLSSAWICRQIPQEVYQYSDCYCRFTLNPATCELSGSAAASPQLRLAPLRSSWRRSTTTYLKQSFLKTPLGAPLHLRCFTELLSLAFPFIIWKYKWFSCSGWSHLRLELPHLSSVEGNLSQENSFNGIIQYTLFQFLKGWCTWHKTCLQMRILGPLSRVMMVRQPFFAKNMQNSHFCVLNLVLPARFYCCNWPGR